MKKKQIVLLIFPIFLVLTHFCLPVFAASYDIKHMTPEVDQAIKNRQARYGELQQLKTSGLIGENNKGYLHPLKDSGNAVSVANEENADRRVIYQTIVEQNNLGAEGLPVVEKAFAAVQNDKARPGDYVQASGGDWVQK